MAKAKSGQDHGSLRTDALEKSGVGCTPEPQRSELTTERELQSKWIEGLSGEMSLSAALLVIFDQRLRTLRFYMRLVVESAPGNDVELIRQLRVATRRLDGALAVLGEGIADARREELAEFVRKIHRKCAVVRELDVRLEDLRKRLESVDESNAASLQLLIDASQRRRERTARRLKRKLPRLYEELKGVTSRLRASLERAVKRARKSEQQFGVVAARTLSQQFDELFSEGDASTQTDSGLNALHAGCKHVRYATEVCAAVLSSQFREDLYPLLQKLQEKLGEYRDLVDARKHVAAFRKKTKRMLKKISRLNLSGKWYVWSDLKPGFDVLDGELLKEQIHVRSRCDETWHRFMGPAFREPMQIELDELTLRFSPGSEPHVESLGQIPERGVPRPTHVEKTSPGSTSTDVENRETHAANPPFAETAARGEKSARSVAKDSDSRSADATLINAAQIGTVQRRGAAPAMLDAQTRSESGISVSSNPEQPAVAAAAVHSIYEPSETAADHATLGSHFAASSGGLIGASKPIDAITGDRTATGESYVDLAQSAFDFRSRPHRRRGDAINRIAADVNGNSTATGGTGNGTSMLKTETPPTESPSNGFGTLGRTSERVPPRKG